VRSATSAARHLTADPTTTDPHLTKHAYPARVRRPVSDVRRTHMEGMTITGFAVALAVCLVIIVAQVLANVFNLVDISAVS